MRNYHRDKHTGKWLTIILTIMLLAVFSACGTKQKVDISHEVTDSSTDEDEPSEIADDSDKNGFESDTGTKTEQGLKSGISSKDAIGETDIITESSASSEESDDDSINLTKAPAPTEEIEEKTTEQPEGTDASQFEVHFLDVGQGDAILVICDGHAMLVDGGKSGQSSKIYSYLRDNGIDHLDFIVATHADSDHVGGLAGALNYATANVALAPVREDDREAFQDFVKYLDKQNVSITIPDAGDQFALGSADVLVLGPVKSSEESNNTSVVLKVIHGDNSFLLTGDAEDEEEESILRSGTDLHSTVLKVAHHGSAYSTGQRWLSAVSPEIAVISCGIDNEYGHPTEEVLNRLKEMDATVLRTDLQGDIIFREENGTLAYSVEKESDADVFVPGIIPVQEDPANKFITRDSINKSAGANSSDGRTYILNTNTKKFHYPDCKSVKKMSDKNKREFTGTRDEVIAMGYDSCGNCKP